MKSTIAEMPPAEASDFVEVKFTVEHNYAGWRLDQYLCVKIRRLSRTRVQEVIKHSLVSDKKLKASSLVTAGMTITLRRRALEEPDTPTDVTELYRDEWLLVLDKPAGLPMHPTARYLKGTLVGLLKTKYGPGFQADPTHRLDRETSGIIVCGRTTESSRRMGFAFERSQVQKEYLAIVEGAPPEDEFEVDAPIAEGTELIRIAVRIDPVAGKAATTRFKVEERFWVGGEPFALVRAFPKTGRQHQIRIHLKVAGFPLVGDKMYGPDEAYFDRFTKHTLEPEAWARLRLPRHALHAAKITFAHPGTAAPLTVEAPLPADLQAFLDSRDVIPAPR